MNCRRGAPPCARGPPASGRRRPGSSRSAASGAAPPPQLHLRTWCVLICQSRRRGTARRIPSAKRLQHLKNKATDGNSAAPAPASRLGQNAIRRPAGVRRGSAGPQAPRRPRRRRAAEAKRSPAGRPGAATGAATARRVAVATAVMAAVAALREASAAPRWRPAQRAACSEARRGAARHRLAPPRRQPRQSLPLRRPRQPLPRRSPPQSLQKRPHLPPRQSRQPLRLLSRCGRASSGWRRGPSRGRAGRPGALLRGRVPISVWLS
mmetsp:Transcript_22904/g.78356  ORF Transcript_22904/g.78356 Transcript_22904/m.78356 type:complete len:265 (+) Transcript_22904:207-1001(+)